MKRAIKIFLINMLLIIAYGCESLTEIDPFNTKNSAIFILTQGAEKQKVYVFRTLENNESVPIYPSINDILEFFEPSANIRVETGQFVFDEFEIFDYYNNTFNSELPLDKYYTDNGKLIISNNKSYSISINVDGSEMKGTVNIPGDFKILNYPSKDTLWVERSYYHKIKLPFQWTESENSEFYGWQVAYAFNDSLSIGGNIFEFDIVWDNGYVEKGALEALVPCWSMVDSAKIDIIAYDRNAYQYYFEGNPSSGVQNAFGVFGAAVQRSVTFVLLDK